MNIPETNQISFESTYEIADIPYPPPIILQNLNTTATVNPIYAIALFLNVGVIRIMKNNAYKYQYGAVG